MSIVKDAFVKI